MIETWNSTILRLGAPQTRSRRLNTAVWSVVAATLLFASSVGLTSQHASRPQSILRLILAGDDDHVRTLVIAHPSALSATDSFGNTPLHLAAATGQKDLVAFLLAHGASPNTRNHHGDTPLLYGLWAPRNQIAVVDALLAAGADPNHCSGVEDQQALIDED